MRILIKIICIFLAINLVACQSTSKQKQIVNQQFLTDIKENNSKLFVFIVSFLQDRPKLRPELASAGRGNSREKMRDRQSLDEQLEERAIKALEDKLRQTGYCRQGYFVLGNYLERGNIEIRGECKESATKADKKLFANT